MRVKTLSAVCIVDGASTGRFLAPAFRSYGVRCVHVQSSRDLQERLTQQITSADYEARLVFDDDLADLTDQLRRLDVTAVIAGVDTGVELAARLAEQLEIEDRNDLATAGARRDKALQIQAVRAGGLNAPRQFHARDTASVVRKAEQHGEFPVVVKPNRGSGVKDVTICRSVDEVRLASDRILASLSSYGERQDLVLLESYSQGQEYIVDVVSALGRHKVVNIWKVTRDRRQFPRLDNMIIADHTSDEYHGIIHYAYEVLTTLGVKSGPSHLELIDGKDGPIIVELNARLHGSLDPRLSTAVMGANHVSETVFAQVAPTCFLDQIDVKPRFSGHSAHALLVSTRDCTLSRPFPCEKLAELESVVDVKIWKQQGSKITETTGLRSALGMIGLHSTSVSQIESDIVAVRHIEREFFASL